MSTLIEATPTSREQLEGPTLEDPLPVLRIEPSHGWISLKLDELWEYRELLYFLTWRDI